MRYLAIDLGDKRTGLATGDDETGLAGPLAVLELPRGEALLDAIDHAIREYLPGALVVGLPLNMDGTEGDRARISRTFGDEVARRTGLPVHYQDERLTSDAADRTLTGRGLSPRRKKKVQDALAAAEILRDYFAARGE
jgi:putative Holliday junction resolvase